MRGTDGDTFMMQIAYSLMALFVVLFLLQEAFWKKLPVILSEEENRTHGIVKPRVLGMAIWFSIGAFFFVVALISAFYHSLPGVVLFLLETFVFSGNGIRISTTSIKYSSTEMSIHGPGIHMDLPMRSITGVHKCGSRIRGTWYLLLCLGNGQKLRFEQINFQGLIGLHEAINDFLICEKNQEG